MQLAGKSTTDPGGTPQMPRWTRPFRLAEGIYCNLRCGACGGAGYTDEDGDLLCVACGRPVPVWQHRTQLSILRGR